MGCKHFPIEGDSVTARRDLIITKIPNRVGTWLAVQQGSVVRAVAKFRDEAAEAEFLAWVDDNAGLPLRTESDQ